MAENYTVLDFESFYDTKQKYSLKNMTPVEYILDQRFECIGCSFAQGDSGKSFFLGGDELLPFFKSERKRQLAGEKLIYVSHNALFDMCLLVWRYGLVPDLMICTMSMAQALLYPLLGYVSLAKVSDHLGVGQKGDTIMHVNGMRATDIKAAGLWQKYANYCLNDTELCRAIFKIMRKMLPPEQLLVIDMVTRCAVKPKFILDRDILSSHLADVKQNKLDLLTSAGLTPDENGKCPELMSNAKFREMLEDRGVEVPMKVSMTTGKLTEAFAKTDQGMADLENHDDPMVQALVAARLGHKTTLEETRTERFLSIANLVWPHTQTAPGWMPMPLKFSGAHTHRLSGQWSLNIQNLRRGGKMRQSLIAPPGFVVVTCDASQIEARLAAWVAAIILGERSPLVEAFAAGVDVYCTFGTDWLYKRVITKADTLERFVSKQAVLGSGFGMGHEKFRKQVRKDMRVQLKLDIDLGEETARAAINAYRHGMSPATPKAWRMLNDLLPALQGWDSKQQFGPVTFHHQKIVGPTGMTLFYPDLRQEQTNDGLEWRFKSGRMTKKLFGGKLYENIIQHLAGCCNIETALKVRKAYPGVELASQVHDELIYVVPGGIEYYMDQGKRKYHLTGFAAEFKPHLEVLMSERPAWGASLPLAAESGAGLSYGDAK